MEHPKENVNIKLKGLRIHNELELLQDFTPEGQPDASASGTDIPSQSTSDESQTPTPISQYQTPAGTPLQEGVTQETQSQIATLQATVQQLYTTLQDYSQRYTFLYEENSTLKQREAQLIANQGHLQKLMQQVGTRRCLLSDGAIFP